MLPKTAAMCGTVAFVEMEDPGNGVPVIYNLNPVVHSFLPAFFPLTANKTVQLKNVVLGVLQLVECKK